jgi:hypothetical protein
MIFDWQYLFDSVKKHGLVAVFMGAIIYIQYRSYEELKVELKAEQKEMKTKLEKQIQDLEIKLLDCQNQRFLELLRQRDND